MTCPFLAGVWTYTVAARPEIAVDVAVYVPVQAVVMVVKDTVAGAVLAAATEEVVDDDEVVNVADEEEEDDNLVDDEEATLDELDDTDVEEAATLDGDDEAATAGQLPGFELMVLATEVRLKYASMLRIFSTLSARGGP